MRAVSSALLVVALALPRTAVAQDAVDARALYGRGEQAFDRGDFATALAYFRSAYELAPLPGFHFNIAQCHRRLGQWREAAQHYESYLAEVPDAPNRADALALLEETRRHLAPSASAARPAASPDTPHPAPPRRGPPARGASPLRPLGWIALAVGAALAVTATFLALRVRSLQDELDDPDLDCVASRSRCLSIRDDGQAAALWTNVAGATALGALAAGVVLHLAAPP